MAVQTIIRNTVNLEEPVVKKILRDTLGSQDNQAHRFEVEVKRGNEAVDLTGATVNGYFIRAGGETVMITGGVEDGAAYVVLNDSCYLVPGRFSFAMKIQAGDVRHTVLWYEGSVGQTSTDSLVDPENIVPSLGELLAQIEAAENAAKSANQATENANEATERANTAAQDAEMVANLTVEATTLPTGSEATAYYENGVLHVGLPRGEKGEKGDTGSASPIKVNGIGAIDDNITLTAEDVGSLPENGTAADAEKLGGKAPEYYLHPRNLLDNSNFTNPVNQRGWVSGSQVSAWQYFIDRWKAFDVDITPTFGANGITVPSNKIAQYLNNLAPYVGKPVTVGIWLSNGNVVVGSGILTNNSSWTSIIQVTSNGCHVGLANGGTNSWDISIEVNGLTLKYAALYEGSYTAENLPPYVPKGYSAELQECMRYFIRYGKTIQNNHIGWAQAATTTVANATLAIPQGMRIYNPTIRIDGSVVLRSGTTDIPIESISANSCSSGPFAYLAINSNGLSVGTNYALRLVSATLDLSADL